MTIQEPGPGDVQHMVEWFGRAGWIISAGVTPHPFAIVWSPKGRRQMTRLRNVLKKYAPRLFDENARRPVGRIAAAMIEYHVRCITIDLKLPLFGPERSLVAAMAVACEEDAEGNIVAIHEDELP